MAKEPETLAEIKAEAERLRAQNDKMISDARTKLDDVERAIDKAEEAEKEKS